MKAEATSIGDVLRGGGQYIIPIFQRTYVWRHRQWTALWEDLVDLLNEDQPSGHFLGSVVCAAVGSEVSKVPSYVIVDGQQRLVTFVALLCAFRDVTKSRPSISSIAALIQDEYLIHKHEEGYERYKLLARTPYRGSLFEIMEGRPSEHQDGIATSYNFFKGRLSAEEFNDNRLNDFLAAITQRLKLVLITLSKEENPFPIFTALNATGIDILQSDMIRNFVFTKMNLDKQNAFDSSEWQPLENLFSGTHDFKAIPLDDFYRDCLTSFGDYVRDEEIYVKFKDHMIKKDAHQVVSDLLPLASLYLQFCRPDTVRDREIRIELSRILDLNQTACFPLLLDLFARHNRKELEHAALVRILRAIESFFLRRQVLGLTTRHYRKWFAEMSALRTHKLELELYQRLVIRGWPRDSEFIGALSTFKLYNSGIDKMILASLQESFASREHLDSSNLEVDHVMPQSITDDDVGQAWKEMLGPRWQEIHYRWLHTLGNLTLSNFNPELGHLLFIEKKNIYRDSKLLLNKHFDTLNKWGEEEIKERSSVLAKAVATIWPTELN